MTITPGQQLDQNTSDIAKLAAKVQVLTEQQAQDGQQITKCMAETGVNTRDIADLQAWRESCNCGTVDIEPEPLPEPTPEPLPPVVGNPYDYVPRDLLMRESDEFVPKKRDWNTDARFEGIKEYPVSGMYGDWCRSVSRNNRLMVRNSEFIRPAHIGYPFGGWGEYYFIGCTFRGLQCANEWNAGSYKAVIANCDYYDVGEDAIRNVYGLIQNVTIHSAKPISNKVHGDTLDLKHNIYGLEVRGLRSLTGNLNGIITKGVKNLVIDGYEHLGAEDHTSIDIGGDAENVTIRNVKASGDIRFRGNKTNVNIDWNTVRVNVPREEFA